jgi:hypothetical protein
MAVSSPSVFYAKGCARLLIMVASIGSLSRFIVNSMFADCKLRPLHREFDVRRLQIAAALDLGLVPILRVALEIFVGQFPGGRVLLGKFLANEGVSGHG